MYKFFVLYFVSLSLATNAQVPVKDEPRHKPVLENKYLRVLDVWLQPGDTTMYHVHATPSLFVVLNSAATTSQIRGASWTNDKYSEIKTWYRSFAADTLIHRVANVDTVAFHVNDIEILSQFDTAVRRSPLEFPVLFENDRSLAYKLASTSFPTKRINGRGPLVAAAVSGQATFHDVTEKKITRVQQGQHLYIPPGKVFYFSSPGGAEMILFEIR
jgi:hypothetical protein